MNYRIQEILNLAHSGRIEEAFKKCERAIKKKPKDIDFLLLAANLYAQLEDYQNIIHYCLRALKLSPKSTSALYNLCVAYLFIKDYSNTVKYSLILVKLDKKNAQAHGNLGLAYWNLGELDDAKSHLLQAMKLDPTIATNHNNIGLIYKSTGDPDNAILHFKQAIKLNPQLAEAYYNCGITLLDTNNTEGNAYLDKALLINPNYAELHNYLGLKSLDNNNLSDAVKHFKQAIESKPDYSEAYCNLGNAFMEENESKKAEMAYRKAIQYNVDYAGAYNNLGNALSEQDDYRRTRAEAEGYYLKAIELAPELNDTYKNIALCFLSGGNIEKSLAYYKIYNEREPGDETAIASMASAYEHCGDYDNGLSLLEPFLENKNVSADVVLSFAKLSRYFDRQEDAITALINIDDNAIINKVKTDKYYALGKLSDPKGDPDTTFNYYKQANDFDEDIFNFEQEATKYSNIKSYFTKEKLHNIPRSEQDTRLPLFIVGMPRSGTSLAEQILASHPDVYGAGELEEIHKITEEIELHFKSKNNYPSCLDKMTSDYATQLTNEHISRLQQFSPDAKYIIDKMPHNFMSLGLINILFPKSTVIHCKRSPIDTCLSIYFQQFNKHHSYSNDLKMLGKYYHLYSDLMQHWHETLDLKIIDRQYEKVISNPEEEMRNLLDKCEIQWDPACMKFYENKRTVMTPSYDQVRRPIYKSSVAKWKKYEHHLGDLITQLGDLAY